MSTTKQQHPGDRLKLLRKRLGKSQAEMAGVLHISTTGYQNYERGERDIPAAVVSRARDHIGLNPRWLLDGVGEMFSSSAEGPEATRIRVSLGFEPNLTQAVHADSEETCSLELRDLRASAGTGALPQDHPDHLGSFTFSKGLLRRVFGFLRRWVRDERRISQRHPFHRTPWSRRGDHG